MKPFLIFISVIFLQFPIFSTPILLDPSSEKISLYGHYEIFEDEGKNLDYEGILRPEIQDRFQLIREENPNLGIKNSSFWIRFRVSNNAPQIHWVIHIPSTHIHSIELYRPSPSGVEVVKSGNRFPFSERIYKSTFFTFDLNSTKEEETYYLRVENTHDALFLPMFIESSRALLEDLSNLKYFYGIYYGVMFAMFVYNLFVYVSVRDKTYLYYLIYLFFITLHLLKENGLAYKYLWPNSPEWNRLSFAFTTPLASGSTVLFCRKFFDLKKLSPHLNTFMKWFGYFIVLSPPIYYYFSDLASLLEYEIAVAGLSSVFLFGFAIYAKIKKFPTSTIFLLAWTSFLLGVLSVVLMNFGILPYHFFTAYGVQIGNGMEATLLSLSIANKIRVLMEEREEARTQLLIEKEESLENLKKIDRLKDEFLANTSHELKTPLHAIINLSESMKSENFGPVTPAMQENLNHIILSGNRLSNLINDILDYSKLKHEDLKLNLKPVNLQNILHLSLLTCKPLLGNKPIVIKNHIQDSIPYVLGDEDRLQQIFLNIIGNAIKFTHSGEISITAEKNSSRGTKKSESSLTIKISDTGIGIAEENLDLIFNSFEQLDGGIQRKFGGTGLGLSLTKKLVEAHGGKIWAESKLTRGTSIFFTLKATETSKDETDLTRTPLFGVTRLNLRDSLVISNTVNSSPVSKILIIDDEVVNIFILKNHLKSAEYETISAESGYLAINLLETQKFDLVLVDLMMPEISGYDVVRKIRENYSRNQLPVIILTAKNQIHDLVESFEFGANDYLTKPFSKEELLARVKIHLDLKKLNDDLEFKVKERTYSLELANRKVENLTQFTRILNEQSDMKKIFIKISEYVSTNFQIDTSCLFLLDKDTGTLSTFRFYSYIKLDMKVINYIESLNFEIFGNHSIITNIFKRKKPLLLNDKFREICNRNPEDKKEILTELDKEIQNQLQLIDTLLVPLVVQNEVIGVYAFSNFNKSIDFQWKKSRELIGFCRHFGGTINSIRLLLQENRSKEIILEEKTKALETLELLRETQNQLIETSKVAALGQLVSSIAHEINTPIGAIKATSGNIQNTVQNFIHSGLKVFRNISEARMKNLGSFLLENLKPKRELTTREERELRKMHFKKLNEYGIQNSEYLSEILSSLRVENLKDEYISLFQENESEDIIGVIQLLTGLILDSSILERSVEKTSKIISTLKSYAGGGYSNEKILLDLSEEIENVLKLYSNKIHQGIQIIKEYLPVPQISCKKEKINQVITNIFHNALSAVGEDGEISIRLRENKLNSNMVVLLEIEDNGHGIPPEDQSKIFEPFQTNKNLGEGIGLGLYVSKRITEEHGGKIEFESRKGRTVFRVYLPV